MYVCTNVCIHIYVSVSISIYKEIPVLSTQCAPAMKTDQPARLYIYICICIYIYIYIYIYIHIALTTGAPAAAGPIPFHPRPNPPARHVSVTVSMARPVARRGRTPSLMLGAYLLLQPLRTDCFYLLLACPLSLRLVTCQPPLSCTCSTMFANQCLA